MRAVRVKRALGVVLVVCAAGVASSGALALPAGTSAASGLVVGPSTGMDTTSFALTLTAPDNACPGDSATGGHRWHTYRVSASVDVATLRYDASGPQVPAGASAETVVQPLSSAAGKARPTSTRWPEAARYPGSST